MTQSYEGKNSQNLLHNSSQDVGSQPVMPDKPILVSKRDFLEQVLQKSHGSSFISDDEETSSVVARESNKEESFQKLDSSRPGKT